MRRTLIVTITLALLATVETVSAIACQPGYGKLGTFSATCGLCPSGTASTGGEGARCLSCSSGYTSSPGSSYCRLYDCPSGYGRGPDGVSCTICRPGTYSYYGMNYCASCYPNTFNSMSGSSSCSPCPAGTTTNNNYGSTSCQPICQPGSYRQYDGTCKLCPAGTYTGFQGESYCSRCTPDKYAPPGSSSCLTCPVNTRPTIGGGSCEAKCAPGTYNIGLYSTGGACYTCSPGSISSTYDASYCTACPAGTYSSENRQECTACAPGFTSPGGSVTCSPIPSYKPRRRRALLCQKGYTACNITTGKGGWECLDIMTNLQSCGGCWGEAEAVDCTTLIEDDDSESTVACVNGVCQVNSQ